MTTATAMANIDLLCFHCGEPLPAHSRLQLELDGITRPMCCQGCLAVATLIAESGLANYYQHRQSLAVKANEDNAAISHAWQSVDQRSNLWGMQGKNQRYDLLLQVSGIRCAACAWLIRSHLEKQKGIDAVQVDTGTGFCRIQWNPLDTRLSQLAGHLFELGYTPHLPTAQAEEDGRRQERLESLKRLGVAGLGMMQVMMYAVGLYAGEAQGMDPAARGFLSWVSLLVSLPVLLYSGRVYFAGAWRGLRSGRPGMDLPVALAIGLAFGASCYQFFIGGGQIWFDSVVMFIFFLSLGRHVELVLRQRNLQAGTALARLLPEWADKLLENGQAETIPASDLRPGNRVRVYAGSPFPADGIIIQGQTGVDESLLTGESQAIEKSPGDSIFAGSINLNQSVDICVTVAHEDSMLSSLGRLLLNAQARHNDDDGLPNWLVPGFILTVLAIAAVAGLYWHMNDPERAIGVSLAVLVASCPCALSLALPVVRSAASLSLLREGILVQRPSGLFKLARINQVIFDKTGTLTLGTPRIERVELNTQRADYDQNSALELAASLEAHSNHALARAFRNFPASIAFSSVKNKAGEGLEGRYDERVIRLGQAGFVESPGLSETNGPVPEQDQAVWLGDDSGWIARFFVTDTLRPGVVSSIANLRNAGIGVSICSGDGEKPVKECARQLEIDTVKWRQSTSDKLIYIRQLKEIGNNVLMVGDGINDAPVLAAADVSIAVHGASDLTNSAADIILTGISLSALDRCFKAAAMARKLVHQNLFWALCYNLSVLPLAVSGMLQPWMAALGMSASSLLVVLNATRMTRKSREKSSIDSVALLTAQPSSENSLVQPTPQ